MSSVQVLHRFEHPEILCIGYQHCTPAVAPDDTLIAVGTASGVVLLLEMKTGEIHSKLVSHKEPVVCVAWSPRAEDEAAVSVSVDRAGNVVFWRQDCRDTEA